MLKKKYDISKEEIREWLITEQEFPPTYEEVDQAEEALIDFAHEHSLTPPPSLRDKILGKLKVFNEHQRNRQLLDRDHLPLLDESANWLDWQAALSEIEPPEDYQNIHLHSLESNEKRELFVVWVKEYVEEEVHDDLMESFLILEGSCECHISNVAGHTRTVRMNTGDFITMQLGETHDIRITSSEPTKAILQWLKLSA